MFCTCRLFGFPLSTTLIVIPAIALSLFLTACGGGDTAPTQVATSVPATPAPPATDLPAPATAVPAATAPPAATGSPGSGVATPESPTVPTTAGATPGPTVAPTQVLASNAVRVLQRSCSEMFRQTLLDYDGDEFNAEVVRQLSDRFVEDRPDCLAEGWDPEFPDKPEVCLVVKDLDSHLSYSHDRRSVRRFLHPTMRESASRRSDDIYLQVHFTKIPLLSMVPSNLLTVPLRPGEAVGGCWLYSGPPDGGGKWTQSVIIYTRIHPEAGLLDRDRRGHSLNVILRNSFPECDELLQEEVSARLDAGEVLDASAVMELVEEVRPQAGGACDRENPRSWMYVPPVDGAAGGCPGTPLTGLQPDGSYVVNWGEHHFDGYGKSACWIRSPEGEWVGYLRE